MKKKNCRPGFWTGVLVGFLFSWGLSKVRVNLNEIARVGYNRFAPDYDTVLAHLSGMEEVRQVLVDKLELESGDRVLEVCVGTGANLPLIAERIGEEGRISGLDISEGMLAQAEKKLMTISCPVELRLGNAEDLSFADNTFDAVLNFGAMNFITDRKKAIDEMIRVAKPGAKIVFGDETLTPDGPVRRLLAKIGLAVMPRLKPPIEFVSGYEVLLSYDKDGLVYIIDLKKINGT